MPIDPLHTAFDAQGAPVQREPRGDRAAGEAGKDDRLQPASDAALRLVLERLAEALRIVREAPTLTRALDTLAAAAAAEAPRTSLYLLSPTASGASGAALERWQPPDGQRLAPALPASPLLAEVARTRSAVSSPSVASTIPGRQEIVVPVVVGDCTVALLHGEGDAGGAWQAALQILTQHASACLSSLTALRLSEAFGERRVAPVPAAEDDGSARRYARLLVSEIKLYNESAVRTGRERRDLFVRLGPEIDRARRLYEERVPVSVGRRATLFQQELVRTLAEGDPNLLGASG